LSNLSANLSAVAPVPPKIEAQPPIAGGATAAAAAAAPAPAPAKPPLEQQINTSIGASTNSLSQADRQLITVYLSGNKGKRQTDRQRQTEKRGGEGVFL
jgi:hypothetical protein